MNASQGLLDILEEFEGFKTESYKDGGGVWTIGYGTTHIKGKSVTEGMTCTKEEAMQYVLDEVAEDVKAVNCAVMIDINQNQFDALVDFCYNCGIHAFQGSTLLKKLNACDYEGAADEFGKWNHDNGKVVAGLTRRRAAEADLFRKNVA